MKLSLRKIIEAYEKQESVNKKIEKSYEEE